MACPQRGIIQNCFVRSIWSWIQGDSAASPPPCVVNISLTLRPSPLCFSSCPFGGVIVCVFSSLTSAAVFLSIMIRSFPSQVPGPRLQHDVRHDDGAADHGTPLLPYVPCVRAAPLVPPCHRGSNSDVSVGRHFCLLWCVPSLMHSGHMAVLCPQARLTHGEERAIPINQPSWPG